MILMHLCVQYSRGSLNLNPWSVPDVPFSIRPQENSGQDDKNAFLNLCEPCHNALDREARDAESHRFELKHPAFRPPERLKNDLSVWNEDSRTLVATVFLEGREV
jgi:hypothetical protein